ncbi:MAG: GTP 3',8-cyclase MoaA [Pseudomonadota bacterium]
MSETHLIDSFDRRIRYLRLSVTDRCNLRCTYCMAEDMVFLPKAKVLSLEELALVGETFIKLGVEKIRLTGGEPLVRKDIVGLAERLGAASGLRELVMTTNGVLLDQYAKSLVDAGMSRINISLDSLQADRFKTMTRFGNLEDVIKGIDAAQEAGFERIKINAVIMRGFNDDEVLDLTQFSIDRGLDISFIEEMPLGIISSHSREKTSVSSQTIRSQLSEKFGLVESSFKDRAGGPARYHYVPNTHTRVGFISPMSENFCSTCNRVRVTTEGQLLLCLGNEDALDLRAIIREGQAAGLNEAQLQTELAQAIVESMQRKPEKHTFDPREIKITRFMSATGG